MEEKIRKKTDLLDREGKQVGMLEEKNSMDQVKKQDGKHHQQICRGHSDRRKTHWQRHPPRGPMDEGNQRKRRKLAWLP